MLSSASIANYDQIFLIKATLRVAFIKNMGLILSQISISLWKITAEGYALLETI